MLLVLHHYLVFEFFAQEWFPFDQVISYFAVCMWLVPFTLFISLSANDLTLPQTAGGGGLSRMNSVDPYFTGGSPAAGGLRWSRHTFISPLHFPGLYIGGEGERPSLQRGFTQEDGPSSSARRHGGLLALLSYVKTKMDDLVPKTQKSF